MYKHNKLLGYVTSASGESPESESAFRFALFCPWESKGNPENSQQEAEEGFHYFTIKRINDNRELVWVSLLRDAMVHRLSTRVTYRYSETEDPGSGEVIKIEVTSFPFMQGSMSSAKGKVVMISVDEYFVWRDKFEILVADTIDVASITLEGFQEIFVLPLRESNKETKLAQLKLLQQAWENQWSVEITYHEPRVSDKYCKIITGVSIGTYD